METFDETDDALGRDRQLLHRSVLNACSSGIIATDAVGKIMFINKQAENILHIPELYKNDICGAGIYDVLPVTGPLVMRCLETGIPQLGKHIFGKTVSLVVNITPIMENGRIEGAVCNFQGMKEFELAAKNLESYKGLTEELQTIIDSSSDGILVSDKDGKIIKLNKASERLTGMKAEDALGKLVTDMAEKGFFDRSVTEEVLKTKKQVSIIQYLKVTKKHLLLTGTPTFDDKGNISLVVINERDMTQLNAIKEQLEQSRMITERYKDEIAQFKILVKNKKIVAESREMKQVLKTALKLARLDATKILILGESGTGKGLIANFIHDNSNHSNKSFVQINCAALPETLLEAELFGYERGAFTGASEYGKAGLFELADGGTLFLDEIGELPLTVQAKLLKYLDDSVIMRIGGLRQKKIKCMIIAATNRDLEMQVETGKFREDLFYRLNTFTLKISPLRDRSEDVLALTNKLLDRFNKQYGKERKISTKMFEMLQTNPLPGNVRELINVLKSAVVMSDSNILDGFIQRKLFNKTKRVDSLSSKESNGFKMVDEINVVEKQILEKVKMQCQSTREMARYLGISQPTVVRKLKKHGL